MIFKTNHVEHSDKREVGEVYIASTEDDAYNQAAFVRRSLVRGTGWRVRTNKRSVQSDGIKVYLWTVTTWRPTFLASACSPDDPSGDLQ